MDRSKQDKMFGSFCFLFFQARNVAIDLREHFPTTSPENKSQPLCMLILPVKTECYYQGVRGAASLVQWGQ